MCKWTAVVIALVGVTSALTAAPPQAPTTQPAEAQADLEGRVSELIGRLGDPSFERREAAMAALREIGEPARDALKKAVDHQDPEIADRAERLLGELDRDPEHGDPPRPFLPPGGGRIQIVQGIGAGAVSVQTLSDGQMRLTVRRDAQGVHVEHETTGKNGKKTTAKADAKDMAALKKKHPKLHALVEKHFGKGGLQVQFRIGVADGPAPLVAPPPVAPAAAKVAAALARMGISGRALDAATCRKLKIPAGILVNGVVNRPGSAGRLGLRRGDVITAINGQALQKATDVAAARRPVASITVLRAGTQVQLTPPPPPREVPPPKLPLPPMEVPPPGTPGPIGPG
jgi:hypothetical protein